MRNPLLSIVIPAYNEEKTIDNCIKSLFNQSYKNFELIIVDDGSKDRTTKIVKKFRKVRLVKGQHKGPGFSRNLGAKKARGDILIFVDADMAFDRDYLKYLIKPIAGQDIIGTENEIQLSANYHQNIWSRCSGKGSFEGSNTNRKIFRAIRKKDFLRMGGFDPKYGYADDQTFFFKYGIKPIIAKGAICYHNNPAALTEVYFQSRWIGASIQNIFFQMPVLKYFVPLLLVFASPVAVVYLSLEKSYKNKDFIIFPWMLVYITARYFGTVSGIFRKIFRGINFR